MKNEFTIKDFMDQYDVAVSIKNDFSGDIVYRIEGIDANIWSYNLIQLARKYEKFLGLEME